MNGSNCVEERKRKKTRNESIQQVHCQVFQKGGHFQPATGDTAGASWGLGSLGKILLPTTQAGKFLKIFGTFTGRQILNQTLENPGLTQSFERRRSMEYYTRLVAKNATVAFHIFPCQQAAPAPRVGGSNMPDGRKLRVS